MTTRTKWFDTPEEMRNFYNNLNENVDFDYGCKTIDGVKKWYVKIVKEN